jgi:MFS family permease
MVAALAPVAALLLAVAVLLMGNGLQSTLLPLRATIEDFSSIDIGVLGSSYFLGFALGCLRGPYVVRRVGHIRTFTAMVAIASTSALVHALLLEPWVWWPMRAITGFCFAVLYMVIESWLNERATNETRGLVFSIYTVINLTMMTFGQLMLMASDPNGFPLFALVSILVSLAAVPVALTGAQAPAPITNVKIRLRHLYAISPVGFVGSLAVGLANGSFWALAPVFARSDEDGVTAVALFMSAVVLGGALGQVPAGRASDRVDRRRVIAAFAVAAGAIGIAMSLAQRDLGQGLLAMGLVFGAAAFPLYSLCAAHLNDFVEDNGFVEASGGLLLLYGIGAVIGPLVASAAMRYGGVAMLFLFTAAVHIALAAFTLYRMRRRQAPAGEERTPFVDSLRVLQTVSTIDPLATDTPEPGDPAGAGDGR